MRCRRSHCAVVCNLLVLLGAAVVNAQQEADTPTVEPGSDQAKIVGNWDALVDYGQGEATDYVLQIRKVGGALQGVLVSPRSGEHKIKSVVWKDQAKALDLRIERDMSGTEVEFHFDARLTEKGLAGSVSIVGTDQLNGTWTAKKRQVPSVAKVVGNWDALVDYGQGETTDYVLQITKVGDALQGVLVSPRSGEHKIKSVVWKEQGKTLNIRIDRDFGGTEVELHLDARLTKEGLSGSVSIMGTDQLNGTWTAKKKTGIVGGEGRGELGCVG